MSSSGIDLVFGFLAISKVKRQQSDFIFVILSLFAFNFTLKTPKEVVVLYTGSKSIYDCREEETVG